jgi:GntR family transcriptional regulator
MIYVDFKSRIPLYEQLVNNIKEQIIKGLLETDMKLPSVRELASSLTINPNTIQKAYSILENEGYIYTVRGRGNYVSTLEDSLIKSQKEKVLKELEIIVKEAIDLGLKKSEVMCVVEKYYMNKDGINND